MKYFDEVKELGCIIVVDLDFSCDLDTANLADGGCPPAITFRRIDDPNANSTGFNFRYINKYYYSSEARPWDASFERRDLTKALGPRIVFNAHGVGGKFDIAVTAITLGYEYIGRAIILPF